MSRLDDALRESLRRQDPGLDFTRKVLAKAAEQPAGKPGWLQRLGIGFRPPAFRWAAAGLAALLLVGSGLEYRREQRIKAEGEAAKQQLVIALQIAGSKLRMAQAKVLQVSR